MKREELTWRSWPSEGLFRVMTWLSPSRRETKVEEPLPSKSSAVWQPRAFIICATSYWVYPQETGYRWP